MTNQSISDPTKLLQFRAKEPTGAKNYCPGTSVNDIYGHHWGDGYWTLGMCERCAATDIYAGRCRIANPEDAQAFLDNPPRPVLGDVSLNLAWLSNALDADRRWATIPLQQFKVMLEAGIHQGPAVKAELRELLKQILAEDLASEMPAGDGKTTRPDNSRFAAGMSGRSIGGAS